MSTQSDIGNEIMTTIEVAQRTRVPVGTLRYYRTVGEGPISFRLGRRVVYLRSDVEKWIADRIASDPLRQMHTANAKSG